MSIKLCYYDMSWISVQNVSNLLAVNLEKFKFDD